MALVPIDADILVERKGIVEPMAQLITELLVDLGNGIGIGRLTHKEADRDLAVWVGKHCPFSRKRESQMASVVLIPSKECQLRIRADIPGQRWRYIHTVAGYV